MSAQVFTCDPRDFKLTNEMRQCYDDKGYILVKGFLDKEELENVRKAVEDTDLFRSRVYGLSDTQGGQGRKALWNQPGSDVTGMLARCEKVAGTAEKLLGGEVYHYHTKLMTKDPRGVGGKHVWHQDYGYWYKNGCLFPDMLSAFIAIDPCRKENGCLQVIEGSHKCGRLDHSGPPNAQQTCDQERLRQIKDKMPHIYVEMDPGDAIFFHCNLLHNSDSNQSETKRWVLIAAYNKASNDPVYKHHCPQYTKLHKVKSASLSPGDVIIFHCNLLHCSDGNLSENKRWVLICAYNKATNDPVYKHHHPLYTKLDKVADSAVRECRNYTDLSGKDFMDRI